MRRFRKFKLGFGTKTTLKTRTDGEADCGHRDLTLSREDMRAVDILVRTMQVTGDDHHDMGLLWRRDHVQVPNNHREAEMRLQSWSLKFHKDSSVQEKHRTNLEDYIAKGYAPNCQTKKLPNRVPERGIFPILQSPAATRQTKNREKHSWIRTCCGAPITQNWSLFEVSQREIVTLVEDIESMFHQVKVLPEDQDSLTFLWWSKSIHEVHQE